MSAAVATSQHRYRIPAQPGEVIDRTQTVSFRWNGKSFTGHPGDTIVSALTASGERIFSRSYKYHRPRGVLTADYHDPGTLLQVGDEPNVRAAHRLLQDGMQVSSQNTWPSLKFDVKSINRLGGRFLTSGFYYKTFMKPQFLRPFYERTLRQFVHAGKVDTGSQQDYFEKRYAHTDVLVAGGGPAGIAAALAAADTGARVLLVDEQHNLGGHLRWADPDTAGQLAHHVQQTENIEVLTDATVVARYDGNWCAIVERHPHPGSPERLVKARARTLIAANGLIERPYVFAGNDLPGVMLSTAARRLINLYAASPGERAVVLTANPDGDAAVADLRRAGVDVAHVADARQGEDVVRAHGRSRLKAVELSDGRRIEADLLITATGWTAPTFLLNMASDVPVYSPQAARFLPGGRAEQGVYSVGGLAGDGTPDQLRDHATAVGAQAAGFALRQRQRHLSRTPTAVSPGTSSGDDDQNIRAAEGTSGPELSIPEHPELFRSSSHGMVDLSEDVSSKDLFTAVEEGYDSAELAKRYTTATMGPTQGKLELVNTIAVIAEATNRSIAETGTTTWRPMHSPLTLGALAGRSFEPVRYSALQPWHQAHGAVPLVAGSWIRPDHYGDPQAEVRAVRNHVGIIDVTPIGKLDLRGPDVPKLLNQLYVNKWSALDIGRVRYGVMCAEDGVVFDDGVTGRLAEDHYLMSTTTSGAGRVLEWVENWLQTERPEWQVHVTPVTTGYTSINVAGPHSRRLLSRLAEGVDLSADAFPYMRVRTGRVAGVEDCILWRIGFTGELSYEVHVPASYGLHVWEALLEAGRDLGVTPFGVEAQRVLRLEKGHFIVGQDTDGLTKGYSAGLDWAIKLDKEDFAGKPELEWQHASGSGTRLVALQPNDPEVVPAEASQILHPDGSIAGRITSSRHSPTLNRAVCLAQLDPVLTDPGTVVEVRLPQGDAIEAVVQPQLAHLDPEGTRLNNETRPEDTVDFPAPVSRSALALGVPSGQVTVSGEAPTLDDCSDLTKVSLRGSPEGPLADALGVRFGKAERSDRGALMVGSGPGEWLVLGEPDRGVESLADLQQLTSQCDELTSVVDLTHGRALLRLSGQDGVRVLSKVCAVDFAEDVTPNGSSFRSSVAKVVTDVVRDDQDGMPSYLLHCERSSGQYLAEALVDAGAVASG